MSGLDAAPRAPELTGVPLTGARTAAGFGQRRARRPVASIAIIVVFVLAAVVGPMLVGDAATQMSLADRLQPPVGFGGSWDHFLGTDKLGRDILARTLGGARVALIVAAASVGLAGLAGLALGVIGGYLGGWRDSLISRVVDISLAFPIVLIALLFAVKFGPSFWNVILVIVLLLWARFARLARGEAVVLREREFVEAARAVGASRSSILVAHIIPNVAGPVLILATLQVGWAILTESSLSFLGAGVPPPAPAWGSMVADGRDLLRSAWWISTVPGAAIMVVTIAFNMVGDWLRDVLDPGQTS